VKQAADRRPARADPARGRRAVADQPAERLPLPDPLLDGAAKICASRKRTLMQIGKRHKVACHFAGELKDPRRARSPRILGSTTRATSGSARAPSPTSRGYADTGTT
jgi:hypothetical protein